MGIRHKTAQIWGMRAERLAAWWLRLKMYRILPQSNAARRGTGVGQVDLVAVRGRVLAFVEVKARADLNQARSAISPVQQARIVRAAQAFLARNPQFSDHQIRFDAVLIAPGHWPTHIPAAWQA